MTEKIKLLGFVAILLGGLAMTHPANSQSYEEAKSDVEHLTELLVSGESQRMVEFASSRDPLIHLMTNANITWEELSPVLVNAWKSAGVGEYSGRELAEEKKFGSKFAVIRYFLNGKLPVQFMLISARFQNLGDRWVVTALHLDGGNEMLSRLGLRR